MNRYFKMAIIIATKNKDGRDFLLGACCVRKDGRVVVAQNIRNADKNHKCHAETRVSRMSDKGSVVYVVRLTKDGKLANSKPCVGCQNSMRARGVKKCFYSISEKEYGVMEL